MQKIVFTDQRRKQRKNGTSAKVRETGELRDLVAHLLQLREADCRRIIDVVENEILSGLVRAQMDLAEACRLSGESRVHRNRHWIRATQGIQRVMTSVALVRTDLQPPLLEHCGLEAAINSTARAWEKRHRLRCRFTSSAIGTRIHPRLELELFRLFEDGLRGLTDCCGPSHLEVSFAITRRFYRLCLSSHAPTQRLLKCLVKSLALLAARERTRRFGGNLTLHRDLEKGLSLVMTIPRPQ